jgi:mono/diheme cytochrome c family protein
MSSRPWIYLSAIAAVVTTGYLQLQAAPGRSMAPAQAAAAVPTAQAVPASAPLAPRAVLDKYCVACHNERLKSGEVVLSGLDVNNVGPGAETWEKVLRKLATQEMPPVGRPRPDQATYEAMAAYFEKALDTAAAAHLNPGRVPIHRLNRTEYANSVRDLLGLEINPRELLPADEADREGFDNNASMLTVSTSLLERYLSAARKISRFAVGSPTIPAVLDTFEVPVALVQDDRVSEDLPFGSQGGTVIDYHFPLDGEYKIKVLLKRQLYLYIMGMGEPHQFDIRLDGALIKRFTVGGEARGMTMPESYAGNTQGDPEFEEYMHTADNHLEVQIPVKAGAHVVGVSFVRQYREPEGVLQPPQRGFARTTNELYFGSPAVGSVSIGGPYAVAGAGDSPSRRKIFTCRPKDASTEEACAKNILSTIARRAYRRPLTEVDVDALMGFYRDGRSRGDFDQGIERGLERILASPSFIFRIERGAMTTAGAAAPYRLSDLDLASRLSFFLWGSIPDDELLNAAIAGRLKDPKVLDAQVRRMLADERTMALVDNFGTQWLKLGQLPGIVPDVDAFPEFDENLRGAMLEETRQFMVSQIREDRSVVELLSANYTFVNERLAKHYGIPNVYGDHFRKVAFTDGVRGGLLGQAGILAATSYPNRTSPVLRGKWLLDTVLGSPPPAPPPNVPPLEATKSTAELRTLRERMEQHRTNAVCASCHARMDPLGFSLENFDGLGKWRTEDEGEPIDSAASLMNGTKLDGVTGLKKLLVNRKEDFVGTLTTKMLAYGIGRNVEYFDMPAVRKITREAAAQNYRWSAVVLGIVKSVPFSMSTPVSSEPDTNVAQSVPGR